MTGTFFLALIFFARLSNSLIKFVTKFIVFWNPPYLFLLKSMFIKFAKFTPDAELFYFLASS